MEVNKNIIVIKSTSKLGVITLHEIWRYRELFFVFAWRDLKVRYKQTVIGALWAILQPVSQTFVFTVFFGRIAKIPSGELPYSLFVLTGLVYWGFFSGVLGSASNALIENENIIRKVYFPKMILPLSKIVVHFVDFLISLLLLLAVSVFLGYIPHPIGLLIIPLGVLIAAVASGGLGLMLGALNVKYRDVRYALPFFLQMLIFVTPVIYPTNIIRPSFRIIMALNPMTGVVEAARVVVAGHTTIDWAILGVSAFSSVVMLIIGAYYFRLTERFFADVV